MSPTRKAPVTDTASESTLRPSQTPSSGSAGRDVLVRRLPEDAYETLRRLAFSHRTTYADVLARLLADSPRQLANLTYWDEAISEAIN